VRGHRRGDSLGGFDGAAQPPARFNRSFASLLLREDRQIQRGLRVSALKAIVSTISLIVMTFWLLFGLGISWVASKAKSDIESSSGESYGSNGETVSTAEERAERRRAARDRISEMEREYRREREGVSIDSGSAKPMVDVDPSHRY
jgi:hypothetical protein